MTSSKQSISAVIRNYLITRPYVRECLRRGLINYSALAREISLDRGLEQFDAVVKACRREQDRMRNKSSLEAPIIGLLSRAKLRIKTQIVVAIVSKEESFIRFSKIQEEIRSQEGDFHLIEGEKAVTIITNNGFVNLLKTTFKGSLKKVTSDLTLVSLLFDRRLETTSGVVAHIYGLLAEKGVNVLEEMSCWTELLMVIEERDLGATLACLKFGRD
jgi:aspartokinase